jgi:hypothetical protein
MANWPGLASWEVGRGDMASGRWWGQLVDGNDWGRALLAGADPPLPLNAVSVAAGDGSAAVDGEADAGYEVVCE